MTAMRLPSTSSAEQDHGGLAPVFPAHPQAAEAEGKNDCEQRGRQRQHDPDPPVVRRVELPVVPGADEGERSVSDYGKKNERCRLSPRNLLGLLDPLGLLELLVAHP